MFEFLLLYEHDLKLIIFIYLLYALYIIYIVMWIDTSSIRYFLEAGLLVALRTSTVIDYL